MDSICLRVEKSKLLDLRDDLIYNIIPFFFLLNST